MNKILIICLLFIGSCTQHKKSNSSQSWVLSPQFSMVSIITTKNNRVSEISEFTKINGKISASGYLEVSIDLNALETNIPIRNQRIGTFLFETTAFPTAEIHTQLKDGDLSIGTHKISFDVDLHGVSAILDAEFIVFEQFGNKVITLHKPLIINAKTFGLEKGIDTLRNLALLDSIDYTVPVNIMLTFEKEL